MAIDVNIKGSKENLTGDYELNLTIKDSSADINGKININGTFAQTATSSASNNTFSVAMGDFSGANTLLNFVMEANSDLKYDPNVIINVPVLTASNSVNLDSIDMENPEPDADGSLEVYVNDNPVKFDVKPFIQDGRTMIPIRNVAEVLGCNVSWVDPDQINITKGNTSIKMYVNKKSYIINGVEKQLDVPPFIKDGKRTVVPLRFIAEGLGCKIDYDQQLNVVFISQ